MKTCSNYFGVVGGFESNFAFSRELFVNGLKKNRFRKITILAGEGMSTSAGVPGLRSLNFNKIL